MKKKRVFKLKTFSRWAKKILTDEQLCSAAEEILACQYEADLGAGVCKNALPFLEKASVGQHELWLLTVARMVYFLWLAAQKVTRVLTFQMHRWHRRN